jgi:hypothetical protein
MSKLAVDFNSLYRRFRLNDQGARRKFYKREAPKDYFHHNSENYRINFSVSAVAPTAVVFGKPYIVEVKVVSTDDETSCSSAPELQLKDYALTLKDKTHFRVPSLVVDSTIFTESDIPLNSGVLNIPLVVNEPVKVHGMFP